MELYTFPKDSFVYSKSDCSSPFLINNALPIWLHVESFDEEYNGDNVRTVDRYAAFAFVKKGDIVSRPKHGLSCSLLTVIPVRK